MLRSVVGIEVTDVVLRGAQLLAGDAQREEDFLLRALPFGAFLRGLLCRLLPGEPAQDRSECGGRGERSPRTVFGFRDSFLAADGFHHLVRESRIRFLSGESGLQFVFEVHHASPSLRRSDSRARCRWLFTVFTGIFTISAISVGLRSSW